jgi:hypothetical protein
MNPNQVPEAAERLERLLESNRDIIVFHADLPDKEYPHVKCSIFGATKTNELFVKLTNGKVTYVEAFKSGLACPAMADRVFGMDVQDSNDAFARAEQMWAKHKTELMRK